MVGMFTRYKRQIILFLFLFGFSLYVYVGVGGPNILYQDRYPNQETHLRDIPFTLTGEDHVLRKDVMAENDANLHIRVQLNSVYVKQKSLTNKITVKRNERIISHHGNKRSKNQPYRNNDKRENHPLNGTSDGRKIHPQRASYMRKTHPHRTSHGRKNRHSIKLHRAKKLKLSDKHGGHKKSAELSEADDNIENKKQNKLCHVPFAYGQMCPVLYTDLGGYCNINKTAPQGFDCPDIRKKGYNQLRSTQLVLTRLLKIFDLVARKHGIKYWITSGTLLGAVRHRGFIPWDEDADIQMTLADYIKLFKCCKNEFPDGIFFQNSETDPYLRPSNETETHLQRHPVVGLYRATWNPRLRDTKSCTRYCLSYGCGWVDGLMIDIFIAEDTLHPYHLSKLFPLKVMLFEGFHLPVPNNWKEILKYKYGNYASEYGEYSKRIPEDNSDPFHSCEELKRAKDKRKKQ